MRAGGNLRMAQQICVGCNSVAILNRNNTRQGYARKRTLKPAGFSFVGYAA
jgi:hypothetical protein